MRALRRAGAEQFENPLKTGRRRPGTILMSKRHNVRKRLMGVGETACTAPPFTPCAVWDSLLEAGIISAKNAAPGGARLLSPVCSSFDPIRNHQRRSEVFGRPASQPKSMNLACSQNRTENLNQNLLRCFLEEKPRREKTNHYHLTYERTLKSAKDK